MLVTVVIFSCYDDCMVKCYLFRLACKVKSVASIISGYRHHTNCIYHYKYILPTKCFRWNKRKINHKKIIVLIPLRSIKQKKNKFFILNAFSLIMIIVFNITSHPHLLSICQNYSNLNHSKREF